MQGYPYWGGGGGGEPLAEKLLIPPPGIIPSNKHPTPSLYTLPTKGSYYNTTKTSFLAIAIAPVPFSFSLHTFSTKLGKGRYAK